MGTVQQPTCSSSRSKISKARKFGPIRSVRVPTGSQRSWETNENKIETIDSCIGQKLSRQQKGAIFAYLFRRISNKEFRSYFEDGIEMKKAHLDNSGYILRNCKIYAWAYWKFKHGKGERPRPSDYEVAVEDARFLRQLNLDHIPLRYKAYDLQEFGRTLNPFIEGKELNDYIGRYISKCLIFLHNHYNVHRTLMHSRILESAIYAVYRKYPFFESELHLRNTAKNAIHNCGQTIIDENKVQARERLSTEKDGTHQAVLQPLSSVEHSLEYVKDDRVEIIRSQLEDLEKIMHKVTPRAQRFLFTLMGQHDEGFSAFVGQPNDVYVDHISYNVYYRRVLRYFNVTEQQAQKVFLKIRHKLHK